VDALTVAAEWQGRTPAWKHEAASLILEAVLIHAQPEDISATVPPRTGEPADQFHARLRQHRLTVLARRVEFVWKA
jgi:hypothetical protein